MPELLSPAGNREKLDAALLYGADAVYLAGVDFGMRQSDNFTDDELRGAVAYAHALGRKVFVTVNILPRDDEYPALERYLRYLASVKPDALIVADLGVLALAREVAPEIELHISTQASVVSSRVALQYARLGARRIILARELSLGEIAAIRRAVGRSVALECFVHGAMCVSYSGMCLLSENMLGRDANHGKCAQPCRWNWKKVPNGAPGVEIVREPSVAVAAEEKRPESPTPLLEDAHCGTFVMSSRDLCMVDHIPDLMEAGVDSFKIEGRMKSAYYTAAVTNAYRMAIDAAVAGRPFDASLLREVASVSHREYGTGHFYGRPSEAPGLKPVPGICRDPGYIREKAYLATVLYADPVSGAAILRQRNRFAAFSDCELLSPGKAGRPVRLYGLTDGDGVPVDAAPHPGMIVCTQLEGAKAGDILRSRD